MQLKGDQWGLCNRTVRRFEKCVTEQISKNTLYKEGFFDLFRHFMHSYAIKSSTVTKLGDFSLEYRNFSKKFCACGAKNVSLNPFFRNNFQKFPFFGGFGAEKCVTEHQNCPPLWPLPFLNNREIVHILNMANENKKTRSWASRTSTHRPASKSSALD